LLSRRHCYTTVGCTFHPIVWAHPAIVHLSPLVSFLHGFQILLRAIPVSLAELVGFDKIIERLPRSYARALFASQLASHFVYERGLTTPEFAFFEFVQDLLGGQ